MLKRSRLTLLVRVLAGSIAALIALEAGLRVFATTDPIPPPRIVADSVGGDRVVRRQLQQGVSIYGFSRAGARLTGNAPARAGATVVILGDSYVVAEQVSDGETMGAQLENIARSNAMPLDVRQYGWSNTAPAQYLLVAGDVKRRWRPTRVFVLISEDDLDFHSQTAASARIRVDSGGRMRIVGAQRDTMPIQSRRRSVLFALVRYRAHLLELRFRRKWTRRPQQLVPDVGGPVEPPADSAELAAMPRAIVEAMRDAYGPALTMVYIAAIGLRADSTPTPGEQRLLDACMSLGVDCVSTRLSMIERRTAGQMSHGTSTTEIGEGHLTPAGHRVIGEIMWTRMTSRSFVSPGMTR